MDTHLTSKQIAQSVAGNSPAEAELHIRNCQRCRESVAQLQDVLRAVAIDARRSAERSPVERARQRNTIVARAYEHSFRPRLWAVATLAVMLLAAVLLVLAPHPSSSPTEIAKQPAPASAPADPDTLLAQVNDELERDTPAALAPVELLLQERGQLMAKDSGMGSKRISKGGSND